MTPVTDTATGLSGRVTTLWVDTDHKVRYMFQPKGVNPEDGQPIPKFDLELGRLDGHSDADLELVDVPLEVLGSHVTDMASGYNGTAVLLVKHPNGCCHVVVQPKGVLKKTQSPIRRCDFDIRQLEGDKIPVLDDVQLSENRKRKPGPLSDAMGIIDSSVPGS